MAIKNTDTRSEIIEAARSEFIARGYEGARTQNIAGHIGVTKAMIHYYFNTKKELFEHVYGASVEQMFEGIPDVLEEDVLLFKKIERLIDRCLQKAASNPEVLGFVLTEGKRNSDWLLPIIQDRISINAISLSQQIEEAASSYVISSVDPNQLLLTIFSLCYYPALSLTINRALMDEASLEQLMSERKGIVLDTVLNWLTA